MGLFMDTFVLVTQPFWFLKVATLFGVRASFLILYIWLQLFKAVVDFHLELIWKAIVWGVAFLALPLRILNALHRERLLEMYLREMLVELENLAWDKKQVDERLQMVMKDCRIMGSIISELEEDYDKALAKIEVLETELQDLKEENIHLTEMLENVNWNLKAQDDDSYDNVDNGKHNTFVKEDIVLRHEELIQDPLVQEDENKGNTRPRDLLKIRSKSCGHVYPLSTGIISPQGLLVDDALYQRREVALSQSLFSAILSILVGIVIWQAEDPCMPLVIALFIVVGMSFRSVVQFFSTIKNRPASDAVALLSFNWFILGTLAYPTLPIVAHVSVELVPNLADRIVHWSGISWLMWHK